MPVYLVSITKIYLFFTLPLSRPPGTTIKYYIGGVKDTASAAIHFCCSCSPHYPLLY